MARLARVVVPGLPYHVTHRGNGRARVFFEHEDRDAYLAHIERYANQHELEIWAWYAMTNHVHLVVVPIQSTSMARTLGNAHGKYAQWVNARRRLSGHLWANRYYSTALDDEHLWAAVRYVELNPVRAGMVARAEDYEFSSARFHCGLEGNRNCGYGGLMSSTSRFPGYIGAHNWSDWLMRGLDDQALERLRCNTMTGRPCGNDDFVSQIERKLDRILRPKDSGRRANYSEPDLTQDLFE